MLYTSTGTSNMQAIFMKAIFVCIFTGLKADLVEKLHQYYVQVCVLINR